MKRVDVNELSKLDDPLIVDVRSPSEYEEDHLPGAISLPVLDDEERDWVGTIYNQESTFEARREGAKKICRNAPELIDAIDRRVDPERPVLLYCWRGGQRSQSLSVILDRIGYNVHRLKGGYKAYRKTVHQFFENRNWSNPLVTIYGYTGSGKTKLLDRLEREGASTVDLEGAANHRGSAFGGIGLGEQPSQKAFERVVYEQLAGAEPPVYVEGESRKIGRRTIPDLLFEELIEVPRVWVETSLEQRVENICEDYPWPECRDPLIDAVDNLKERMGKDTVSSLQESLREGNLRPVVRELLESYYDPAYEKSCPDRDEFDLRLQGDDLGATTEELLATPVGA